MAANNYFGFTHGGTQYRASSIVLSPQPASAYPAPQPATYVQPAAAHHQPAAYAAAPAARAAPTAYESYAPAGHTAAGQYAAYTAAARAPAAATYDAGKTYYAAPAATAAAPAPAAVYTVADTTYQTGTAYKGPAYQAGAYKGTVYQTGAYKAKPAYSTASYTAPAAQRQTVTVKAPVPQSTAAAGYTTYHSQAPVSAPASSATPYPATTSAPSAATTYSGYDAALYSAATSYLQQQHSSKAVGGSAGNGSTWQYKKVGGGLGLAAGTGRLGTSHSLAGSAGTTSSALKAKIIPRPQPSQLHYCEVCKISCAAPQTYREHLEGQKHKKKEQAQKAAQPSSVNRQQNQLRCELCDVACTGSDAYAAHIRGAKHQKVHKLHTKLGKPIPPPEPVAAASASAAKAGSTATKPGITTAKSVTITTPVVKKVVATPKITFVGGTQLKSTGNKVDEVKAEKTAEEKDKLLLPGEKEVLPVGQEYIEEVKNESGKIVSFNCKLCECKFNDPNAKEMHMKGRRHRLMYKKKVDPNLLVPVKPTFRERKFQEWQQKRMEEQQYWNMVGFRPRAPMMGPPPMMGGPGMPPQPRAMFGNMRRPDTTDDRHVMGKHNAIYPNEEELTTVQNLVSACEKALKLVSDYVAECDSPKIVAVKKEKIAIKKEVKKEPGKDGDNKDDSATRALKGVMRVGVLAKGLLLHTDLNMQLVLLCNEKPTRTLLMRVADNLPKQLATCCEGDDGYEVKMCVEEAAVIVMTDKDPRASCTITLTSPIMRDENEAGETVTVKDPPDVLDRQKCLDALAALRHAKWFQARANGLPSCVVVIRILRDLCQRVPTWTPLSQWAMELLVEKCVSSGPNNMSPGDALRRVFECLASGILLPGGPGLYDPCEKEAADCAAALTAQEREDITASAQHALRLIAFRQIHKVLGMDQLPAPRFPRRPGFNPRKRRHTNSQGDDEGKKDKKEN